MGPYVRYMFCMSQPHPSREIPAWLPPSVLLQKSKPKPDPAARVRRAVGGWLGQLADIGFGLDMAFRELARLRHETGRGERVPIDINLGWVLVSRAICWIKALQLRLAAETRAAKRAAEASARPSGGPVSAFDAMLQEFLKLDKQMRAGQKPKRARKPREIRPNPWDREWGPPANIDGKSMAEVTAQILADLYAAERLLIDPIARRQIEAIAAEARALLGESGVALLPLPRVIGRPQAAAASPPADGVAPAAPAPVPGPGTG